jgi:hypothetical protein
LDSRKIRILVGSGRQLFSFQLFGIPTLINLIPLGGVTLSKQPTDNATLGYFLFLGSGLLVNFGRAAIAWWFAAPGALLDFRGGSIGTLFFWANVVVLAENLLPRQVQTRLEP